MAAIVFQHVCKRRMNFFVKTIQMLPDLNNRKRRIAIIRYVVFIKKYILSNTNVEEASKDNYDELLKTIESSLNDVKYAGAYDQLSLYNGVFMLLYDQRSSMAQVNVDEQQILSLMDEVNSLAKI